MIVTASLWQEKYIDKWPIYEGCTRNSSSNWMSMVFSSITISFYSHWSVHWQSLSEFLVAMPYFSLLPSSWTFRVKWNYSQRSPLHKRLVIFPSSLGKPCNSILPVENLCTQWFCIKVVLMYFGPRSYRRLIALLSSLLWIESCGNPINNLFQVLKSVYLFWMR